MSLYDLKSVTSSFEVPMSLVLFRKCCNTTDTHIDYRNPPLCLHRQLLNNLTLGCIYRMCSWKVEAASVHCLLYNNETVTGTRLLLIKSSYSQ